MSKIKEILCRIVEHNKGEYKNRDASIILFGAWFGTRFADNSRFLYQYLSENKTQLGLTHVVWVTRNKRICNQIRNMGYEVYMMDSQEAIMYHKKAGTHIVCNQPNKQLGIGGDILGEYSYGATKINVWHGNAGMKGVFCASNEYKSVKSVHPIYVGIKEFLRMHSRLFREFAQEPGGWSNCYYLAPTQADVKIMQSYFLLPEERFILTEYPRNCECPRFTDEEIMILNKIKTFRKTILYVPTFRTGKSNFDFTNLADTILSTLEEYDMVWIEKPHGAGKIVNTWPGNSHNIIRLSSEFDINVLIPNVDLIITDYSSVIADAVYHQKDLLFYIPDFWEYRDGDRGFLIDPEEMMCGPKVFSVSELKQVLKSYASNAEIIKTGNYDLIKRKYWGSEKNCFEIWEDICKRVK